MWKLPPFPLPTTPIFSVHLPPSFEHAVTHDAKEETTFISEEQSTAHEDLLIVSPYITRPHLLDLKPLNRPQVLLAKALTLFSPATQAYATVPYIDAFNWDIVFNSLAAAVKSEALLWEEQYFYIVVFRSQIPPSTDRSHLTELDIKAHAEAMKSGGLLKYWFGVPDTDGRNLATCE